MYVALLRGINVGGANKVDMKQLAATFEAAGMKSVKTYINSGNVIFATAIRARARLVKPLEKAIAQRFGLEIKVLVRDLVQMRAVANAIPTRWTNDQKMKCDVMFLWKEIDRPSVLEQLRFDPKIEDVRYAGGAVIWRVDRKHQTRSG